MPETAADVLQSTATPRFSARETPRIAPNVPTISHPRVSIRSFLLLRMSLTGHRFSPRRRAPAALGHVHFCRARYRVATELLPARASAGNSRCRPAISMCCPRVPARTRASRPLPDPGQVPELNSARPAASPDLSAAQLHPPLVCCSLSALPKRPLLSTAATARHIAVHSYQPRAAECCTAPISLPRRSLALAAH